MPTWIENFNLSFGQEIPALTYPLTTANKVALEFLPIGVGIADLRCEFVYLNARVQEWFGGAFGPVPEEKRFRNWAQTHGVYETNRFRLVTREALPWVAASQGKSLGTTDIFLRHDPAPMERYLRLSSSPLLNGDGKLCANLVTLTDVSTLYEKHRELQNACDFFQTIFYSVPEPLAVSDPQTSAFLFANQSFIELLHSRRHRLLGVPAFEKRLWRDSRQRERVQDELSRTGRVRSETIEFDLPSSPSLSFSFDLLHWGTGAVWLWKAVSLQKPLDENSGTARDWEVSPGTPWISATKANS